MDSEGPEGRAGSEGSRGFGFKHPRDGLYFDEALYPDDVSPIANTR